MAREAILFTLAENSAPLLPGVRYGEAPRSVHGPTLEEMTAPCSLLEFQSLLDDEPFDDVPPLWLQ
jgi:hypothetical protein